MSDEYQDEYQEEYQDLTLWPQWKEAAHRFRDHGYDYGSKISRHQLERLIGIKPIDERERITYAEYRKRELEFLQSFYPFRDAVLEMHQMYLETDNRGSYTIAHPRDQADIALKHAERGIKRVIDKSTGIARNVNMSMLDTAEERKAYIDTLAKLLDMQSRNNMKRRELPSGE